MGTDYPDESHELKHVHTETTKAICRLFAPYRWCVLLRRGPKAWCMPLPCFHSWVSNHLTKPQCWATFLQLNCSFASIANIIHRCFSRSSSILHGGNVNDMSRCRCHLLQKKSSVEFEFPELYHRLLDVIRFRLDLDGLIGRPTRTRILHYVRWLRQMATHASLNRLTNFGMPSCD